MGGFVEDHGAGFALEGIQVLFAVGLIHRQKALKGKTPRGKSRKRQCGDTGATAGDGGDGDSLRSAKSNQILPRVRNGGSAGIGHQRTGFSCLQAVTDLFSALPLVVLMVGDQGLLNIQVGQQMPRITGILGGDEVHLGQHLDGPLG